LNQLEANPQYFADDLDASWEVLARGIEGISRASQQAFTNTLKIPGTDSNLTSNPQRTSPQSRACL
jgi:hypothetical protein